MSSCSFKNGITNKLFVYNSYIDIYITSQKVWNHIYLLCFKIIKIVGTLFTAAFL